VVLGDPRFDDDHYRAGRRRLGPRHRGRHDWWDWYAAYLDARQGGSTPEQATETAGRYMAEVKHVISPAEEQERTVIMNPQIGGSL
jgi:hypothetical protein